MGEDWARKLIAKGKVTIGDVEYDIVKQPKGGCDGCAFYNGPIGGFNCPSITEVSDTGRYRHRSGITICTTGGHIFKRTER